MATEGRLLCRRSSSETCTRAGPMMRNRGGSFFPVAVLSNHAPLAVTARTGGNRFAASSQMLLEDCAVITTPPAAFLWPTLLPHAPE